MCSSVASPDAACGSGLRCPVCEGPVSGWRFIGTHVPHPEDETVLCKAHTRHVRCVSCRRIVILDRWEYAAPLRPYHAPCWEEHCADQAPPARG